MARHPKKWDGQYGLSFLKEQDCKSSNPGAFAIYFGFLYSATAIDKTFGHRYFAIHALQGFDIFSI